MKNKKKKNEAKDKKNGREMQRKREIFDLIRFVCAVLWTEQTQQFNKIKYKNTFTSMPHNNIQWNQYFILNLNTNANKTNEIVQIFFSASKPA